MPKDRQAYNAYQRRYQRERYARQKAAIVKMLGGQCARCGSIQELQLDHVNPKDKAFDINKWMNCSLERLTPEIKKCQVLCRSCHETKTIFDKGNKPAVGTHGTLSAYRYCRCDKCKEAKARWSRSYKRSRRLAAKAPT